MIFDMNDYDVTKLPFTCISRENWEMLLELDNETLYDVIQKVGNYVLTGERCNCEQTMSKIVCNQLINVIDRKGQKTHNSFKNLPPKKKSTPKQENEQPEPQPAPTPNKDDEYWIDEFLYDPTMDFSCLFSNLSYLKQRKKDELNTLYKRLGGRYTGDQIIQMLQERYMNKSYNQ